MSKLIVVGSGIKSVAHLTQETIKVIQNVDKVLYLVNEDILKQWITKQANLAESLEYIYFDYKNRQEAYQQITQYIIEQYKAYDSLCVVFYGHPSVFAKSALDAVKRINQAQGDAIVLPAISAMDCLFADLEIDPGEGGCFSIDATELLIYERVIDVHSHLILWQAANLGRNDLCPTTKTQVLVDYLNRFYKLEHKVCIYEAAILPTQKPRIEWSSLKQLNNTKLSMISALYIPLVVKDEISAEYMNKLNMELENYSAQSD